MSNMLNLFSRPDWSGKTGHSGKKRDCALDSARGKEGKERKSVELAENGADG